MRTAPLGALVCALLVAPLAAQAPGPVPVSAKAPADTAKPKPLPKIDISKLKFMSGCWAGEIDKDNSVEETWSTISENLLLSTTRYLTKKNFATGYEFSRIQVTDSGVVFAASSNGKPEDVYLMKTLVDEYVLFENPKKAFPQRIMYRLASDGALIPRNEGDGPSVEVRFKRIKCPGADIKLKN
jgi:hypothetical protein